MDGKKENNLIIIENGQLTSYMLDNKNVWEVGRPSKENIPDIKLHSATVSRRHGKFQKWNGIQSETYKTGNQWKSQTSHA